VVPVSKKHILVWDISLMNLMDECALFACMEETMEIFFSVPPFHANVDYRSKPGERGWWGEDSIFYFSSFLLNIYIKATQITTDNHQFYYCTAW
jgi:hypothetical protein